MTTGLYTHPIFDQHQVTPGHPERPERLPAIRAALHSANLWDRLTHREPTTADEAILARLHTPEYVARLREACSAGGGILDTPDCPVCPATWEAALRSAGAAMDAVDAVMAGELNNAFCLARPPGHHAEADKAMGFCFFANVALAADHLTRVHGLSRVAIVDFDVHHSNGTQHLLESRRDVLLISLHEDPRYQYPGTGFANETGTGDGEGFTVNFPLMPGTGDDFVRDLFDEKILPQLAEYRPEFVLISAGFDAHADDPLGHLEFSEDLYAWMTRQLMDVADMHAHGRIVSCLEGGYDLDALADAAAHVRALLGD